MEKIQKLIHQKTKNSCELSPRDSVEHELSKYGSSEISVFPGPKATDIQIAQSVKKLAVAFPNMKADFFNLLAERIDKAGLSAERLQYAVNHVLDNFRYKQLNIADIMSLDVKCKVYSYQEMCGELRNGVTSNDYAPVFFGNAKKPHYVLKIDKSRYDLPDRIW